MNKMIKYIANDETILCIGCGVTFAALVIQFIIVSTN